MEDNITLDPKK